MLSPKEFRTEYPADELEAELPERPITSLRDIQYVYGKLYTLATAGGGEYAAYLTPDQASDLMDEPESLIVVRVDLSGEEPRLDQEMPVRVTRYTEDLVEQVAHCKYAAARGIDHSVTHRSGRNSGEDKLARYAKERLTKWATDEVVQSAATDHAESWIIDGLAELGTNEAALESIENAVVEQLGGKTTALLTVQVKLEPDGDFRWPGDIEIFNEAMKHRKLDKLVSKGEASESAGSAVDLLTEARTRTVGTAEDPLNYYLGKQLEKFPGLDPDEAWRAHPVSEDAAVTIMNAQEFVDACTYSTFGATVYYLPYYMGQLSAEQAYELYDVLYTATENGGDMTPIEETYEQLGDRIYEEEGFRLRFYVAAVMKHQASRYDVYGETLNGSIIYPSRLAGAHENLLRSEAFHATADQRLTPPLPTHENWTLLTPVDFLPVVSQGSYFYQTFPKGDDDNDASADDPRIRALVSVLGGESLSVEGLIGNYVDRLLADDGDDFPSFLVAAQFAQLCALAAAELLTAETEAGETITRKPEYDRSGMTSTRPTAMADGGSAATDRTRKLEQFIDSTPALNDTAEYLDEEERRYNRQRRGTFLLGALVGAVGSYQEWHEDRSTTLVDQFPVKSVTTTRIKKITQEAVGKTLTYTRQENRSTTKFEWIVERLRKTILDPDPDDWDLDTDDLRFYYALGVTYGMNDRPDSDDESTSETTDSE